MADGCGVLMEVSAKDDNPAAHRGIAGERDVAAKDENVARGRTVEKNISGEDAKAAGGASIDVGGAE